MEPRSASLMAATGEARFRARSTDGVGQFAVRPMPPKQRRPVLRCTKLLDTEMCCHFVARLAPVVKWPQPFAVAALPARGRGYISWRIGNRPADVRRQKVGGPRDGAQPRDPRRQIRSRQEPDF